MFEPEGIPQRLRVRACPGAVYALCRLTAPLVDTSRARRRLLEAFGVRGVHDALGGGTGAPGVFL